MSDAPTGPVEPGRGRYVHLPEIPPPNPIPETLEPLTKAPDMDALLDPALPGGVGDRIRAVWDVVERFVEEAVRAAEIMFGPGTGSSKRSFVVERTMHLLESLEESVDLVPRWMQGIVFTGLRFSLGFMVERVLASLKARGLV